VLRLREVLLKVTLVMTVFIVTAPLAFQQLVLGGTPSMLFEISEFIERRAVGCVGIASSIQEMQFS